MSILRAEIIMRIREGVKAGKGATRLYWELRAVGPVTRKTDFLADYRDVAQLKAKEGLARYVRKGYVPAERSAEIKAWAMSKEYMYVVRCQQTFAGVPADKPTFINLMHDTPQTIEALEIEAWERTFPQSPPKSGEERKFVVETAIHRAEG